jgi:hypothetical protein
MDMRHKFTASALRSTRAPGQAQKAPSATKLYFDINRITLHGYAESAQQRFAHALKTSLTELAKSHRDYDWANAMPMRIGRFDCDELRPGASPEESAQHIARHIFLKLTQQAGGGRNA